MKLKNPVDQEISCRSCWTEISFEASQENNGLCDECKRDLDSGRTICY